MCIIERNLDQQKKSVYVVRMNNKRIKWSMCIKKKAINDWWSALLVTVERLKS